MGKPLTVIGIVAALTAGAVGLVGAQDSAVPQVQSPPDEAAPPPGGQTPASPPVVATDEAGLPKAPVPYTVLGPTASERPRRAAAPARTDPAASSPLEPGEIAKTAPRPRHTGAILQAVDKVTAETLRFEAQVGKPVRYKSLIFTLRACESEAADELVKESAAHVTITSQPKAQPGRVRPDPAQIFRGWMFASSPGLNPFEHTVYDAWLVACTPLPTPPAEPAAPATTPPPVRRAPVRVAPAPARTTQARTSPETVDSPPEATPPG